MFRRFFSVATILSTAALVVVLVLWIDSYVASMSFGRCDDLMTADLVHNTTGNIRLQVQRYRSPDYREAIGLMSKRHWDFERYFRPGFQPYSIGPTPRFGGAWRRQEVDRIEWGLSIDHAVLAVLFACLPFVRWHRGRRDRSGAVAAIRPRHVVLSTLLASGIQAIVFVAIMMGTDVERSSAPLDRELGYHDQSAQCTWAIRPLVGRITIRAVQGRRSVQAIGLPSGRGASDGWIDHVIDIHPPNQPLPAWARDDIERLIQEQRTADVVTLGVGWPRPWISCRTFCDGNGHIEGYRLHAIGAVVDVAIPTAFLLTAWATAVGSVRSRRARRGRCVACGYPVGPSVRCPECGA